MEQSVLQASRSSSYSVWSVIMWSEGSFILITIAAIAGLGLAIRNIRIVGIFIAWSIVVKLLSLTNFFVDTESIPPRFIFLIIPSLLIVFYSVKTQVQNKIQIGWLISIHILRVPVELILSHLYTEGLIPELMTYHGWNFDILSGLSAIAITWLYLKNRLSIPVLMVWNTLSMFMLLTIVFLAVLSAPTPMQQFAFSQPNIAVLRFPYTWLPSIVVSIVLLSHLLIYKVERKDMQVNPASD